MTSFREKIAKDKFLITVELTPPKGTNVDPLRSVIENIKNLADIANITDNPRSIMKLSSLVAAQKVKEWGMEPILQMTCRDHNQLALQSTLLGASLSGINNILVLNGDQPNKGDHPETKGVFDLDPIGLLKTIDSLNQGKDRAGNLLDGKTDLFPGAVTSPCDDDQDFQLKRLAEKIEAGAKFIQTQPVFEPEKLRAFLKRTKESGIPPFKLIIGIMPLKSVRTVDFLNTKVPGITVNQDIRKRMEGKDFREGFEIARELIEEMKPLIHGIHLIPVGLENELPEFLEKLQYLRK